MLFNCLGGEGAGGQHSGPLVRQVQSSVYMEDTIRRMEELGQRLWWKLAPAMPSPGL